jgi:hypothetical protein
VGVVGDVVEGAVWGRALDQEEMDVVEVLPVVVVGLGEEMTIPLVTVTGEGRPGEGVE